MSASSRRIAAIAVGLLLVVFGLGASEAQALTVTQGGFPQNTTIKVTSPAGEVKTYQSDAKGEITYDVEHGATYMVEVSGRHPRFYYYEDVTSRQWDEPYGIHDVDDVLRAKGAYEASLVRATDAIEAADKACDATAFEEAKAAYIAVIDYNLAALGNRLRDVADSDPQGPLAEALRREITSLQGLRDSTADLPFEPCPRFRIGSDGTRDRGNDSRVGSASSGPVEYTPVCDAFGSGFFYIPGTDTCLRIGGAVRSDYEIRDFDEGTVDTSRMPDICADLGSGFFHLPATRTCVSVGSEVPDDYDVRRIGPSLAGEAAAADEGTGFGDGPTFRFETRSYFVEGAGLQFLARDLGGRISYDESNVDREGSGLGFEGGFELPLGSGFILGLGAGYFESEGTEFGGSPGGTMDFLLLPGLGVTGTGGGNPAGDAVGFFGGLNAHTYGYDWQLSRIGFEATLGTMIERGAVALHPWAGLRAAFSGGEDSFDVSVPGFMVDVSYDAETSARSFGVVAGINTSIALPAGRVIDSWFLDVRGGVDVNRVETDWRRVLNRPGFSDVQQVTVEETYATPYLYGEVGVNLGFGPRVGGKISVFTEISDTGPALALPGGGSEPKSHGDASRSMGVKVMLKF